MLKHNPVAGSSKTVHFTFHAMKNHPRLAAMEDGHAGGVESMHFHGDGQLGTFPQVFQLPKALQANALRLLAADAIFQVSEIHHMVDNFRALFN